MTANTIEAILISVKINVAGSQIHQLSALTEEVTSETYALASIA